MTRWLIGIVCAAAAWGQGTVTKAKADAYEVHGTAKTVELGAEYMVHSFSRGDQMFLVKDYLVVEVALFPAKDTTINVRAGGFRLRIDGKKSLLTPQAPEMVTASLQNPEWEHNSPNYGISGGTRNSGVILGGPPQNRDPFPGSQPPGSKPPNRIPVPRDNPSGVEKEPVNAAEILLQTALPEGERHSPCSGFLYFAYRGKVTGIKSIELLFEDTVLKLK